MSAEFAELSAPVGSELDAALAAPHKPIAVAGNPVLRLAATPVGATLNDPRIARFAELLCVTMRAWNGVGLAAPQLGISLRIAVLEDRAEIPASSAARAERTPLSLLTLVDPHYEELDAQRVALPEGCLSLPGWRAVVRRAREITLHWTGLDGEHHEQRLRGWPARIAQHEVDHLDGILYTDRADIRTLTSIEEHRRQHANRKRLHPPPDPSATPRSNFAHRHPEL